MKKIERGVSVVKDFKLLKVEERLLLNNILIPREVLEAIRPEQLEKLPIQIDETTVIVGYTKDVRREGDWFIADLHLFIDVDIEAMINESEQVERILGLVLRLEGYSP